MRWATSLFIFASLLLLLHTQGPLASAQELCAPHGSQPIPSGQCSIRIEQSQFEPVIADISQGTRVIFNNATVQDKVVVSFACSFTTYTIGPRFSESVPSKSLEIPMIGLPEGVQVCEYGEVSRFRHLQGTIYVIPVGLPATGVGLPRTHPAAWLALIASGGAAAVSLRLSRR